MAKGNNQKAANGTALEFADQLWAAADKIRDHRLGPYEGHGFETCFGPRNAGGFWQDLHLDLKFS